MNVWLLQYISCTLPTSRSISKVHRWVLERQSSVFRDMFSVPPDSQTENVEGSCDSNPIVLFGDIPEHVEALFFYLYMG